MSLRKIVALPMGFLAGIALAQSGSAIPQGGSGHTSQASCVILKRMGPADEITSHLYSFGFRGKQFQYVEGKLPEGFPFHGRWTDHDVRNLQARGAEVMVLNQDFTVNDLKQARADCRGEASTTPNRPEAQASPLPGPAPNVQSSAATVAATGKLSLSSTPDNADIEVDGSFIGNTPSDVQVAEGEHTVSVKKSGYKDWQRTLKVSAGSSVHLNAELEKTATQ